MKNTKDLVFVRQCTLSRVVLNDELGVVSGINDSGAKVVMLIKDFDQLYSLKEIKKSYDIDFTLENTELATHLLIWHGLYEFYQYDEIGFKHYFLDENYKWVKTIVDYRQCDGCIILKRD